MPLRSCAPTVPAAFGEQAVQIGQRAVAVDEESKALTVGLARPRCSAERFVQTLPPKFALAVPTFLGRLRAFITAGPRLLRQAGRIVWHYEIVASRRLLYGKGEMEPFVTVRFGRYEPPFS
jgi:hypothetical protein